MIISVLCQVYKIGKNNWISVCLLQVLKVFDEPLEESDTERKFKTSAGISKEGIR